jgi:hypothetical protein
LTNEKSVRARISEVSSVSGDPASFVTVTPVESTQARTVAVVPSDAVTWASSIRGVPDTRVPSVFHSWACASNSSSADSVRIEDRSVAIAVEGSEYACHMEARTKSTCWDASSSLAMPAPAVLAGPADCGWMVLGTDCGTAAGSDSAPEAPGADCDVVTDLPTSAKTTHTAATRMTARPTQAATNHFPVSFLTDMGALLPLRILGKSYQ